MKKIKVGINGFGRIGRLALRASWQWPEFEFVQINDPAGDATTFAHLLKFDSVQGQWSPSTSADDNAIYIDGKRIAFSRNKTIAETDWSGCDLVIEASGKMREVR
ncbi:MAG TPA: glyceraldehyde 3-phosphate dehydrogenase NAD-binding domain-containing protein, partial [Cellvibrio sp.]